MASPCAPIVVDGLVVEYGSKHKKVRAVDGLSFSVHDGECVGFIGPNGAGKSTTIKVLMGFVFPRSGTATIYGERAGHVSSRRRIGYLPEVALYYPYMKARELLELYGGLHGLGRNALSARIPELMEEVGLGGMEERLLKTFSKGMQQRLGIAQAIIADPDLLIFDELSSGLDPVGRYDLRQVLLGLKKRGRTIFFSSHELSEVEDLCDRVLIIHRGRCIEQARVNELLQPLNRFRVTFALDHHSAMPALLARHNLSPCGNMQYCCQLTGAAAYAEALQALANVGARIIETQSEQVSLEQHFMRLIRANDSSPAEVAP